MKTPITATDFGEPWRATFSDIYDREDATIFGERERIVSCVNACAGMADPAAEIQAMRDAAASACELLQEIEDHLDGNRGMFVQAALAKLRSVL